MASPRLNEAISLLPRNPELLPFPLRCRAVSGQERDMKAARFGNEDPIYRTRRMGSDSAKKASTSGGTCEIST
jgi:hypothetical protein